MDEVLYSGDMLTVSLFFLNEQHLFELACLNFATILHFAELLDLAFYF